MENIGHYRITKIIAEGGMAIVYQAFQQSLKRPVAIKVLKQSFSGDPRVVSYFNRESLIIARLIHPNIIHIIDRGLTDQGMPYFVMDYIEGTDIAKLIPKGKLTFNRKLDIVVQTCKALAYAHKNGIIHRDIKPANILIDQEGNALVTDFGIAQFYIKGEELKEEKPKEVLGTPSYMSPEQKVNSADITFASDIYSLGVVMYELFTEQRFKEPMKRPSAIKSDIPEPLERLMLSCVMADADKRPASVETIKNQLFSMFHGAHVQDAKRQKAFSGVPKMDDIATVMDVIRECPETTVYLLQHKQRDALMVAKTFSSMNEGIKASRLLLSLKHDNIVTVQGVSGSGDNSIVITEYLSGGSLADRMVMPQTQQEALIILRQVCLGLKFAHANRITHGNITPSNILFTGTGRVKLSDFKPAPNRNLKEGVALDILTVGALFYRMIIGYNPELKGDSFVPHKQFKTLSDSMKRFVYRLLTQKPAIRFQSIAQIIESIDAMEGLLDHGEGKVLSLDDELSEHTQKAPVAKAKTKPSVSLFRYLFLAVLSLLTIGLVAGYYLAPEETRHILQGVFQAMERLIETLKTFMQ